MLKIKHNTKPTLYLQVFTFFVASYAKNKIFLFRLCVWRCWENNMKPIPLIVNETKSTKINLSKSGCVTFGDRVSKSILHRYMGYWIGFYCSIGWLTSHIITQPGWGLPLRWLELSVCDIALRCQNAVKYRHI